MMPGPQDGGFFGTGTIEQSRRQNSEQPAAEAPGPGFFESIGIGYRRSQAQEDWGRNQINWEHSAMREIEAGLEQRGHVFMSPQIQQRFTAERRRTPALSFSAFRRRIVLEALDSERRRDPRFMAQYADVHDEATLTAWASRARAERVEQLDRQAQGGSGVGAIVGQIGGGFTDPINYIPVGGGPVRVAGTSVARQIVAAGARGAAINSAVTAATEPLVQADAQRIGVDRTASDFLFDLGVSAVTGGVIDAGARAVPHIVEAATPVPIRIAREIRRAPIDEAAAAEIADARAFAEAVPRPARTADQEAALNVLGRDARVRAGSPFLPGPQGDDTHFAWLDRALADMNAGGRLLAAEPRPLSRDEVRTGTADMGRVRSPDYERVKASIHRSEAPGRDDYNEASGAMGPYQFLESTWVQLYRRRYPREGARRSDAEIAALRRNPALNEQLMNDALGAYEQVLTRNGQSVDAGNLYLSHALGPDTAVMFLRNPAASAHELIRRSQLRRRGEAGARRFADEAVRNNPFLRGSAGAAIAWTRQRMAGAAGAPPGGRRFATRQEAIVSLGEQLVAQGLIVGENRHVGNRRFTPGAHRTGQAHGEYMIDVNDGNMPPGSPQIEARNPRVRARFDRIALEAQASGYRVLWNEHVYEPFGGGPGRRIPGENSDGRQHRNHIHFEAPQSLVDGSASPLPDTRAYAGGADGEAIPPPGEVVEIDEAEVDMGAMLGLAGDEDRPILRPDLFASPEEHARAQLRFEAERDARDGFAAVRDPADIEFEPMEWLDALRARAAGAESLRPEAVAEAFGISPAEARRIAELLAQADDAPITIGRDGRIQRLATPPPAPKSLLEFLAERGGLEDVDGDFAAMDAGQWHRGAVGRRRLLRERSASARRGEAESVSHAPDMSFAAAIDAGYFPQHAGLRDAIAAGRYDDLPDLAVFREAVDRELRGQPTFAETDLEAVTTAARATADPELRARMDEIAAAADEDFGLRFEHDDAVLARAAEISADPRFDGTLVEAWLLAADQTSDEISARALAETGNPGYGDGDDFDFPAGPEGRDDGGDFGRSEGEPGDEGARRTDAEDPAPDPEGAERGGGFADPVGESARGQSDSIEHDLRMEAADPETAGTYRIDEEGEEADVAELLRDLDETRAAIDAMDACMAPRRPGDGGGE